MVGARWWRSVAAQVWCTVAVLAVVTTALIWVDSRADLRHERRDVSVQLARQATTDARALSSAVAPGGTNETGIASIAGQPAIARVTPQCSSFLSTLQRALPSGYLAVIDRTGRVLCSADPARPVGSTPFKDVPVVRAAAGGARALTDGPFTDPVDGSLSMLTAVPLPEHPGAALAYVLDSQSFFAQLQAKDDSFISLVVDVRTSKVLMRTPALQGAVGTSLAGKPLETAADSSGLTTVKGLDGHRQMYRSLGVTGTPYRLLVGVDEHEALAPVRASLKRSLLSGLVLVALVAALGMVLQRRIARPAKALRTAIEALAEDPEAPSAPLDGPSELAVVAHAFNATAEARRRADGLSRAIVKNASDYLLVVDDAARVTFIAPAARAALGVDVGDGLLQLIGRVHPDDRDAVSRTVREWVRDTSDDLVLEVRVKDDDQVWYAEVRASDQRHDRSVGGVVLTCRDVTERKRYEQRLSHAALHDSLTGLPNRAAVLERLTTTLADPDSVPACVFFVDLDRFKLVNDSHGHAVGDKVLVALAEKLREVVRPRDLVGRFGGDEFVVVTDHLGRADAADELALRIREALGEPLLVGRRELFVSGSVGIAFGDLGDTAEAVLRNADTAMYRAKATGRNCSAVYDEAMRAAARGQLRTESDLHRALERQQLRLRYQPVLALRDDAVTGVEALLRWEHPERGLLLPGEFLPVAEETGMVVPIGAWVLHEACTWAVSSALHLGRPVPVSVNVSPRQLTQPDFADSVAEMLDRTGLSPRLLCLEVSETVLVQDTVVAARTLRALDDLGVRLAIDDFGTGWSSLTSLQQFPVDEIKLDHSCVSRLGTDPTAETIVGALIGMAHSIGLTVTAEGVETPEQLRFLRAQGCDEVQGHLFAEAQQPEEVLTVLALGTLRPRAASDDLRETTRAAAT